MSELRNSNVVNINSETDSEKGVERHVLRRVTLVLNNDSQNAESIVGLRPSHQGCNIPEMRGVARLSPPSVVGRGGTILSVKSDTIGGSPRHQGYNIPEIRGVARLSPPSVAGRGGTILGVNNDTIGGSPRHFGSKPTNAREATRKRSLDKKVELRNSLSDVGLDTVGGHVVMRPRST